MDGRVSAIKETGYYNKIKFFQQIPNSISRRNPKLSLEDLLWTFFKKKLSMAEKVVNPIPYPPPGVGSKIMIYFMQ